MRALFCGVLLAGLGASPGLWSRVTPGAAAATTWWVADRGRDRLVGLDADLFVQRRIELRAPFAVVPGAEGAVWVASAPQGQRLAEHRLVLVDATGCALVDVRVPAVRELAPMGDGGVLVLCGARDESATVLRLGPRGESGGALELPGAVALATRGERALALLPGGGLALIDARRMVLSDIRWLDLAPIDVCACSRGRWWVLDGGQPARLVLVSTTLAALDEIALDLAQPRLAERCGTRGEVWVVDGARGRALRVGPGCRREVFARAPVPGFERAWPDGAGLVAATAGAIVRLDGRGRLAPSQGGFAFAVAATSAGGSSAPR